MAETVKLSRCLRVLLNTPHPKSLKVKEVENAMLSKGLSFDFDPEKYAEFNIQVSSGFINSLYIQYIYLYIYLY